MRLGPAAPPRLGPADGHTCSSSSSSWESGSASLRGGDESGSAVEQAHPAENNCLGRMSLRLLSGSQASASKGTAPSPSVPVVHFHCGTATSVKGQELS